MLFQKRDGLHSGDLEAFSAAHVLTHQKIVFAQHVGFCFGKPGTIAIVGARRQLLFLGAHQPADLIFAGLLAVRTIQTMRLLLFLLVKEITLFHETFIFSLPYLISISTEIIA